LDTLTFFFWYFYKYGVEEKSVPALCREINWALSTFAIINRFWWNFQKLLEILTSDDIVLRNKITIIISLLFYLSKLYHVMKLYVIITSGHVSQNWKFESKKLIYVLQMKYTIYPIKYCLNLLKRFCPKIINKYWGVCPCKPLTVSKWDLWKEVSRNTSIGVPKCLYFKYDSEYVLHFVVTWLLCTVTCWKKVIQICRYWYQNANYWESSASYNDFKHQ